MNVFVNLKKIGKLRNSIDKVPFVLSKDINTVEALIAETVKICVTQYNNRKEHSELLTNLSETEISDMASGGKISFGVNYGENEANEDEAVKNALQCFEDGIFRLFLNGTNLEKLEDTIKVNENDELTFVRLTMLAGRMW
jgi:hypothetical protein